MFIFRSVHHQRRCQYFWIDIYIGLIYYTFITFAWVKQTEKSCYKYELLLNSQFTWSWYVLCILTSFRVLCAGQNTQLVCATKRIKQVLFLKLFKTFLDLFWNYSSKFIWNFLRTFWMFFWTVFETFRGVIQTIHSVIDQIISH